MDRPTPDTENALEPDPLVLRYLTHVRVEKRLAERTVTLYTLDLEKLQTLAAQGLCNFWQGQYLRRVCRYLVHNAARGARGCQHAKPTTGVHLGHTRLSKCGDLRQNLGSDRTHQGQCADTPALDVGHGGPNGVE